MDSTTTDYMDGPEDVKLPEVFMFLHPLQHVVSEGLYDPEAGDE